MRVPITLFLGCMLLLTGCASSTGDSFSLTYNEQARDQINFDNGNLTAVINRETENDESVYRQIDDTKEKNDETPGIYVYVSGCISCPGVYFVDGESRIFEVVNAAGGVTSDGDISGINMAAVVNDGMKIHIPSCISEEENYDNLGDTSYTISETNLVNINTADKNLLMTLPGIGESRATAIITYRQNNGRFTDIAQIKNVSGIKEKTYENLKSLICVSPQ